MAKQDIHDLYYQDQKTGMVEIFVTLRLPVNMYEAGAALAKISNHRSFDDYVSDCVVSDLETFSQGEIADDIVSKKITHKNSAWMQNQKEQWGRFIKRQKKRDRENKKTHCTKCGEWLEGSSICGECGEISK